MTTEQSTQSTDCPPPAEPDPGCDPKLISDLACKSKGVAAQAEYNKTYQEALTKAQVDYDTARKTYRAARQAAALQVQDLTHQIKHVIERIKCLIEQKRVVRCIDDAFCEIVEELDECGPKPGCCVGECTFETADLESLSYEQLVARISEYQKHADDSHVCFTTLTAEPAALLKRVADVKAALDEINARLNADPASTDLKRVYAQALVAARDVSEARIWAGFKETHEYVDCLCRALTCWTLACDAVSVLTGAKAVQDCRREAETLRCELLRTNTVEEILARYDKLCPQQDCDDKGGDGKGDNGGKGDCPPHDEDDCGHDHHHHHDDDHGGGRNPAQQQTSA